MISIRQSAVTLLGALALPVWVDAAPPAAPSDLILVRSDDGGSAIFEWVDNSNDELGFQYELTPLGEDPIILFGPVADVTSDIISGFTPGDIIDVRIRSAKVNAQNELEPSAWSNSVSVETIFADVYTSAVTATPGRDFSYTIVTDFAAEGFTIIGSLPAWLSFNTSTGEFTASAPPAGSVHLNYEAFSGIHHRAGYIYINVINEPPVLAASIDPITIVDQAGGTPPIEIDLSTVFEDGDFTRAAIIGSSEGDISVGFYTGFPITIDNFFAYALSDAWDGSFFHRMPYRSGIEEPFVLQGGGFKPGATPDAYLSVPPLSPIANEYDPARSNICGSIAMAKEGGDPDSATSHFFFSLSDNSENLDNQNGGFTAFGRGVDLGAANRIAKFSRSGFIVDVDATPTLLEDWPFSPLDETSPSHGQLVMISDVVEISPLNYEGAVGGDIVVSTAAPVSLGDPFTLTPTGLAGVGQVSITATDLDGASVTADFEVTVLSSYPAWIEDEAIAPLPEDPQENPGGGAFNNLQSYAFGGSAALGSDDAGRAPAPTLVDVEGETYPALEVYHRKYVSDLEYSVQASTDLVLWTTIWTSSDGFDAPQILVKEDAGEFWKLTVKSDQPAGHAHLFRVSVTLSSG